MEITAKNDVFFNCSKNLLASRRGCNSVKKKSKNSKIGKNEFFEAQSTLVDDIISFRPLSSELESADKTICTFAVFGRGGR